MTLTIEEIFDLALFAGLRVGKLGVDDVDTELTIEDCPEKGVLQDDKTSIKTAHIAYYADYPDEGVTPLGKEIEQNTESEARR